MYHLKINACVDYSKTYETIDEALAAARAMARPDAPEPTLERGECYLALVWPEVGNWISEVVQVVCAK